MSPAETFSAPHRRFNPLSGAWTLVSPNRAKRPWSGQVEDIPKEVQHSYDANCYLCAGNTRVSGTVNPDYKGPYVFENDHAALTAPNGISQSSGPADPKDLFRGEVANGHCQVICYSEDHSLTMAEMEEEQIQQIITTWIKLHRGYEDSFQVVQLFENKGAINGCSNPHPHGQVWASDHIPTDIQVEHMNQRAYFSKNETPLLLDYVHQELSKQDRLVCVNKDWIALVPYWASWPFEILIAPRTHQAKMQHLSPKMQRTLAALLKRITVKYDNLFKTSFPYSMGWHQAPNKSTSNSAPSDEDAWLLHGHFYPPLLRSSTIKKFMVGYELLAEVQRDMTPEQAAEMLRSCSDIHYTQCSSHD
ncbi:UDP-glucose--hexose-1-phosphate uridylyltransferase [Temperatibacter marinus]|uniref:Galactose-1-phosphate uridylyltransferase n=1 Tax=Temperatibacter marinus TaxID=1456591 RepID=A0AA52EG06_9PROT|nr:UDP-glucose--hexose-1-phosphate uridylyltransferase [Temperatibacter marinus]WND04096.1 UDP-glucose--hexose-1-phosphate uridylyltransferase [Temperatibacter marinus]